MQRGIALQLAVAGLLVCALCGVALMEGGGERTELRDKKRYACTNSVDCLKIPVDNDDNEKDGIGQPSEFLKELVHQVATEDYMPTASMHYMGVASSLIKVAKDQMKRARLLRFQAKQRDDKAERLEGKIAKVKAVYESKKSVAQWFQTQALTAKDLADEKSRSIQQDQVLKRKLAKHVMEQGEILRFLRDEASHSRRQT